MGDGHVYSGSLEYILDLPLLAGQKVRERWQKLKHSSGPRTVCVFILDLAAAAIHSFSSRAAV